MMPWNLDIRAQACRWGARRGRSSRGEPLGRARWRARAALARVRGPAAEEFRRRGFELVPCDLRVGPVSVRARLELDRRRVLFDPASLAELREAMRWAGLDRPADPLDLVLAHELFHLFDPGCPDELAEAAAHMFATELLGLDYFAGTLDEVQREFRRSGGGTRAGGWLGRWLTTLCILVLACPAVADVLLVPLDDRPANLLFVRQIARIGGVEVVVPPRHLLGRFLRSGEPGAIQNWLRRTAEPGDTVFLSADMLCYGGLVASRAAAVSQEQALDRLETVRELAATGVTFEVFAAVPRLSLRTSEAQAPHERKLAEWATKPGNPPPEDVPAWAVEEYLRVRARNLAVLLRLVELARERTIARLVLGQDDSHATGLHQLDQERLREAMKGNRSVSLVSGADEIAMDMLAGWIARRAGVQLAVRLVYSDPEAAERVPPLESLPLDRMIRDHLALAGARVASAGPADVELHIQVPLAKPWTVPEDSHRPDAEAFVAGVLQAMNGGRRVAVADLALVNRMDPFMAQAVIDRVPLWHLEGFASWNTPANAAGTAVAQLVVHRVAQAGGKGWSLHRLLESEKTHQAFLLARMIDDYGYQTLVREQARPMAAGLPPDPDPLLNLYGPVGLQIRVELIGWARELYQRNFRGQTVCLEPLDRKARLGPMDLEVVLPWPRVFEVEARLDLRLEPTDEPCRTPGKAGLNPRP
ncbi:MAG: DUF4127 family protein [Armatimonadetes bacterium]|nr:DUF4127 family protein [Armatimonadota bacterium]